MDIKHLTWVEISRKAIGNNISSFRTLVGRDCKIMAVVKANAYGHGLLEVAGIALESGADTLGAFSIEEAVFLRKAGVTGDIFVLGYVLADNMPLVCEYDLCAGITSPEHLKSALNVLCGRKIRLHLKFDTGLRRLGFLPADIPGLMSLLDKSANVDICGIYSHFANIEDTLNHDFAQLQRETFESMCRPVMEKYRVSRHVACSAAALLFPQTYFEMVRTGISMYGMWPSKETLITSLMTESKNTPLEPALTWKTRIAQIKAVVPGDTVGYGRSHRVTRPGIIATLPIGYADGYDRKLSNRSHVLIGGTEAPVLGRICMNMCMVDISHIKGVSMEDEVVLLGRQGDKVITADDLAELVGTINYEITTKISPLLPRLIV